MSIKGNAMQASDSASTHTEPALDPRWRSRRDVARWVRAFGTYFPRKAHLAERVAARLAGANAYDDLAQHLPHEAQPDKRVEVTDSVFAKRRMVKFKEDRLILVREFRILPDAADLFLTLCPVGCHQCFFDGEKKDAYFDPELSLYKDDQVPSPILDSILEDQRQQALGQRLATVDSTARLGEFAQPALIYNLFNFLAWNFSPDLNGCELIDPYTPMARAGWINDAELGRIECFALRFTAHPAWARDEVFWKVLAELKMTRNLSESPVLILNNRPQQLVKHGRTYTAAGWIVMASKVIPWFITHKRTALSETLVELVTFDPASSDAVADEGNVALSVFWKLLVDTEAPQLPPHPQFRAMPDNWMVIPVPNQSPSLGNSVK